MFIPSSGPWSIQDFSSEENLTLGTYQSITGGYLTLQPLDLGSYSFSRRWANPSSWSIDNNLNSINIIETDFTRIAEAGISGQIIPLAASGYSQHLVQAGSWNIRTEIPQRFNGPFSGQEARGLVLSSTSPDSGWYNHFTAGGTDATIEFDIASIYDGYSGRSVLGYTTGQGFLTGLPRLTGLLGHGLYVDNGTSWDFIELNPFGIRSTNHPELAIPIDLNQSKRLRVGIAGSNIYLSTEDGRGLAGISKFNTAVNSGQNAKLFFGSPPVSGANWRYPFLNNGISGFVGETFWDNIKVVYGQNIISERTGLPNYFTTTTQTSYTDVFDPGIKIINWNSAIVGHTQHRGGVSSVGVQYSGTTGWTTHSIIRMTGQQSPSKIDLTSLPVYTYSRSGNHTKITNPVRFTIQQQSYGQSQPPAIDYISISAATEDSLLDLLPNWKLSNQSTTIQIAVDSGKFYSSRPQADQYTTFLLSTPNAPGILTGNSRFEESSLSSRSVIVSGSVENIYRGPSSNAIRNYIETSGAAIRNSEASNYFGESIVTNYFPNPLMEDGFYNVSGNTSYVHNRSFGELAVGLVMVPAYTGKSSVIYQAQSIYRPEAQANIQRINSYLNRPQSPETQYVQTVTVPANSFDGTHDRTCGFEAVIPSGIASGSLLLNVDIQVPYGTGVQIYASGSVQGSPSWFLPGGHYRQYRNISLPIVGSTGQINIGFIVPSGTVSSDFISYNVDNLTVSPIAPGYLYSTGITSFAYTQGLMRDSVAGASVIDISRAGTVVSMDTKILAYPTGSNNILFSKRRTSDNKGFSLYLTESGYLSSLIDMESKAWTSGAAFSTLMTESFAVTGGVSDYVVPLGRWLNIGFAHQSDTYTKLGYANYSGSSNPVNFASSNRAYITVDGSPVYTVDLMRNWSTSHTGQLAPYISYVADQTGTVVIASGLFVEIDNVKLSKPVLADTEVDLSIRSARVTSPYFVPDLYFKPTVSDTVTNVLANSGSSILGKDLYLGSIYNFDGPGYTNWDHGPWGNHLLFYGSLSKSVLSPYQTGGLGSTYIPSGSYALAKYSSTTERLINTTGNLGSSNDLGIMSGRFKFGGWVYPFTSGQDFFHIFKNVSVLTGESISLGYSNDMKLTLSKRDNSQSLLWQKTGTFTHQTGSWVWVEVNTSLGNHSGAGQTGLVSIILRSLSGQELDTGFTGVNYGFNYVGRNGSSGESCIAFGKTASVALSDWFISPVCSGDASYIYNPRGDKSGRYQTLLQDNVLSSYTIDWESYNRMSTRIEALDPEDITFSIGCHNYYDESSRMNFGIHLFDDQPFKVLPSYYLNYSTAELQSKIGNNNSPIRIGYQVPNGAINLGRISSPSFTSESSISVIDLSFKNPSNLTSYKDGVYSIRRNGGTTGAYSTTGSFKGLNSGQFSGMLNLTMSGQVHSSDIDITSIGISNDSLDSPTEAFYCYLLGRGKYGLKLSDSYPHPTGTLGFYTTGAICDNYISNIERVHSSITIKDSEGNVIPFNSYPYSVITSPYSPQILYNDINLGTSISIEGIGSYTGSEKLSDGIFSVLLLTNSRTLNNTTSLWAHYPSIDLSTQELNLASKEIINPIPIMRKTAIGESPIPGQYKFDIDPDTLLYSVTIHGVNSGYLNKL